MRINKYLALCGLGSRRKVEEHITGGRVRVNGKTVTDLSRDINPEADIVEFNRKRMTPQSRFLYIMLNKPKGYITSMKDEENRDVVMDLIPERYRDAGVFPVGRLDRDTEGLLLFTNDGDLAQRLMHPRYGVMKEYVVRLDRTIEKADRLKMQAGIRVDGKKTAPSLISLLDRPGRTVKMVISEGKKRQVRLTFEKFGYEVEKLRRTALGPLHLTGLKSGSCRQLKEKEIRALRGALSLPPED